MSSAQGVAAVAVGVVVIAGVLYFSGSLSGPSASPTTSTSTSTSAHTYSNEAHKISFSYPSRYFALEHEVGQGGAGHYIIGLFDDTQFNRDLVAGKIQNTEGPIGIVVDILDNPQHLTAQSWMKNAKESNYELSNKQFSAASVSGLTGVTYQWSGLYNGKTVVVANSRYVYVFNALYDAPTDYTLVDFPDILKSVQIQ